MNKRNLNDLYDMIEDIGTAMLVTERDGELRSRPMRGKLYRDSGEIWFLTESVSGKTLELMSEQTCNLAYSCPEKEIYISISGTGEWTRSQDEIDDMWNAAAKAWFQCDKEDGRVSAIRFIPKKAEYWNSPSSALVQTWEIAKSNVTGDKPDMGENEKIVMS